jgi:hypothetical protein
MTDQPDNWLAAERERNGCATVLGTRTGLVITKGNYLRQNTEGSGGGRQTRVKKP